jgi:hypothetical protein
MKIEATINSPYFFIDDKAGIIYLEGKSVMEDPYNFYNSIITELKSFIEKNEQDIIFKVQLDYFNTKSSLMIMQMFNILKEGYKKGYNMKIDWYYEEDDEDMYESGIDYKSIIKYPFNLILINKD